MSALSQRLLVEVKKIIHGVKKRFPATGSPVHWVSARSKMARKPTPGKVSLVYDAKKRVHTEKKDVLRGVNKRFPSTFVSASSKIHRIRKLIAKIKPKPSIKNTASDANANPESSIKNTASDANSNPESSTNETADFDEDGDSPDPVFDTRLSWNNETRNDELAAAINQSFTEAPIESSSAVDQELLARLQKRDNRLLDLIKKKASKHCQSVVDKMTEIRKRKADTIDHLVQQGKSLDLALHKKYKAKYQAKLKAKRDEIDNKLVEEKQYSDAKLTQVRRTEQKKLDKAKDEKLEMEEEYKAKLTAMEDKIQRHDSLVTTHQVNPVSETEPSTAQASKPITGAEQSATEHQSLLASLEQLKAEAEKLNKDLLDARTKLADADSRNTASEAQAQTSKDDSAALRAELAALKQKHNVDVEKVNKTLADAETKLADAHTKTGTLETQIQQSNQDKAALHAEFVAFKQQYTADADRHSEQLTVTNGQLGNASEQYLLLHGEAQRLQSENAQLRTQLDNVAAGAEQLKAHAESQAHTAEAAYNDIVATGRQVEAEMHKLSGELAGSKTRNTEIEAEIKRLSTDLASSRTSGTDIQAEMNRLSTEFASSKNRNTELEAENKRLFAELAAGQTQYSEIASNFKEVQASKSNLENEVQQIRAELEVVQKDRNSVQAALNYKVEELDYEKRCRESQLAEAEAQYQHLYSELEGLANEKNDQILILQEAYLQEKGAADDIMAYAKAQQENLTANPSIEDDFGRERLADEEIDKLYIQKDMAQSRALHEADMRRQAELERDEIRTEGEAALNDQQLQLQSQYDTQKKGKLRLLDFTVKTLLSWQCDVNLRTTSALRKHIEVAYKAYETYKKLVEDKGLDQPAINEPPMHVAALNVLLKEIKQETLKELTGLMNDFLARGDEEDDDDDDPLEKNVIADSMTFTRVVVRHLTERIREGEQRSRKPLQDTKATLKEERAKVKKDLRRLITAEQDKQARAHRKKRIPKNGHRTDAGVRKQHREEAKNKRGKMKVNDATMDALTDLFVKGTKVQELPTRAEDGTAIKMEEEEESSFVWPAQFIGTTVDLTAGEAADADASAEMDEDEDEVI